MGDGERAVQVAAAGVFAEADLGAGAAGADEGAGVQRQAEFAGQDAGQALGLVVAAQAAADRVHRDGEQGVEREAVQRRTPGRGRSRRAAGPAARRAGGGRGT